MRQIVLDTETTGLSVADGHRIIEIGCVELINRQFTDRTFHQYIHPQREIDQGALAVHGITKQFLSDKPKFQEIIQQLLDFIQDAELIIHNAPFDVGFLDYEFKLVGNQFKPLAHYCSVFDTLQFARKKHPGQHNSLDALCKRYEIDNSNREQHGALLDAHLLAQVYLAMTGGQTSFFVENQTESKPIISSERTQIKSSRKRNLKVVSPTEIELQAHMQNILFIKAANGGKCLFEMIESKNHAVET